jgi:hypothetical protein
VSTSRRAITILAELGATLLVLAGLFRLVRGFLNNGYLPPPFVFDVGDTFMDWFNTAYWAHNPGAYSVWKTIYLPLSFVLTGTLGDPSCYANAPYDARDCDTVGIAIILATYVACVACAGLAFYRRDRSTAPLRAIAIGIGGPLLFALERGNLIMLAFPAFFLVYGGILKSNRASAAAMAFLANMTVYLIFPLAALAIKRDWRLLEMCGIASLALYLISLLIVGAGTPFELARNLEGWFNFRAGAIWDEILYSTTYKPFLLLDVGQFPVRDYLDQRWVDLVKAVIQYELVASRAIAVMCIALAWFYPRAISANRLVFFILMQSFIGQNPGGYAITLIVFLVFMERWRNFGTGLAIICAYLMCIPGDFTLTTIFEVQRESWLAGRIVNSPYVLPLGSLVRPGVLAITLWALAIDSLIDIHRAVKAGPPKLGLLPRTRSEAMVVPPGLVAK